MKKLTFILFGIFFSISLISQTYYCLETKGFLNEIYNKTYSTEYIYEYYKNKYPLHKHNNEVYVSFLAKTNSSFNNKTLENLSIRIGAKKSNIISLRIPISNINKINNLEGIEYLSLARKIKPDLDRVLGDVRADSVHLGLDLPSHFSGKNVIIGVTDWGFDYTHPMFYDTSFTETRILKAWDQFRNSGPAPEGFDFGTELTGAFELLQAECDTFNIYQWATHGSHVAGIAGGSGGGTIYRGVAYDANFLFATFLVDETSVFDAFVWMQNNAEELDKRLVINMSWGLYYMGNLDGTSLLGEAMETMSNEGVVFVSSAGNNGNVNFHIKHDFPYEGDTLKTLIEFDNYSWYQNMWGQSLTLWGAANSWFNASIKVYNGAGQIIEETPWFSTSNGNEYIDDYIVIGSDTIFYKIGIEENNPLNNRPHMRIRVRNIKTNLYKLALFVNSENTTVHCWNVIELTNDVGNWGLPFTALKTGWRAGDKAYGIGEPACNESTIAVAAYAAEYYTPGGNLAGGAISTFSSFGPIMDGRMKPDIAAPGANVCSSISSFTNSSVTAVETISFNERDYKFARFSGTSMSGPVVTGIVALMLEANPELSPQQIKEIIKITARQDNRTGEIPPTGHTRWGWGKIHAWWAILYSLWNNNMAINIENPFFIYPNPAKDIINIINENKLPYNLSIYNSTGQLISAHFFHTDAIIDVSDYAEGLYIINYSTANKTYSQRFIKLN